MSRLNYVLLSNHPYINQKEQLHLKRNQRLQDVRIRTSAYEFPRLMSLYPS